MSFVVDTSIIIAVLINEKSKSGLIKITQGEDLIAPSSIHWEIGNVFSAMFKRKKIGLNVAREAIGYYSLIPLRLVDVDIIRALEISHDYHIYAYDAYFLECARNYNSTLVTLDSGLSEVAKEMNIDVKEV